MVQDVGESLLANTDYGISMQLQRKAKRKLIRDNRLYDRDFIRNQLSMIRNAIYNATFGMVEDDCVW